MSYKNNIISQIKSKPRQDSNKFFVIKSKIINITIEAIDLKNKDLPTCCKLSFF